MIYTTEHEGLKTTAVVMAEAGTFADQFTPAIVGTGVARCKPDDVYSAETGETIALGRAIQDFGAQVAEIGVAESVSKDEARRVLAALFSL